MATQSVTAVLSHLYRQVTIVSQDVDFPIAWALIGVQCDVAMSCTDANDTPTFRRIMESGLVLMLRGWR